MKKITLCLFILSYAINLFGQIPYGNNPAVGKTVQTKDALIYYEVYGKGEPLLLIYGSLYGYIDEFAIILPDLSEKFRVFSVALRGHGKSDIGDRDCFYDLFADDIMQVMDEEKLESFSILDFSSGAITATRIAADYPERVYKVVSIEGALGAKDKSPESGHVAVLLNRSIYLDYAIPLLKNK